MKYIYSIFLLMISNSQMTAQNASKLAPCPNSPNCVSTQAVKKSKKMLPLKFEEETDLALQRLKKVIAKNPQAELVEEETGYLRYEFTTKVGKFIDDVEFLFDVENKVIHFRSASRKGYGDFGKNKRRMKKISKLWTIPT